jgi:hypothetical protein
MVAVPPTPALRNGKDAAASFHRILLESHRIGSEPLSNSALNVTTPINQALTGVTPAACQHPS